MTSLSPFYLTKFYPRGVNFLKWMNSFEFYLEIIQVPEHKKAITLLNMVEINTIISMQSKIAPYDIRCLAYDTIVSLLTHVFSYYRGKYAARYRFEWRNQFPVEGARQYAETLLKLYHKCEYDGSISVNITERFINGLTNKHAQALLLGMREVTLDFAVTFAERTKGPEVPSLYVDD